MPWPNPAIAIWATLKKDSRLTTRFIRNRVTSSRKDRQAPE
jgi:hypothetical protein